MPETVACHRAHIIPVDGDRTAVHVVEAHEQIDERRLAAARRADDGDALAGADIEVHILEQRCLRHVAERHMLQRDAARHVRERFGIRRVGDLLRLVHQRKDTSSAGDSVLQLGDNAGNFIERLGVLVGIAEENRQAADRNGTCHGRHGTRKANTGIDHAGDKARDRVRQRGEERRTERCLTQCLVQRAEARLGARLIAERLHDLLPVDHLVEEGRLLAARLRLLAEHIISARGDEFCRKEGQRRQHDDDERDLPVQIEHDAECAEDREHTRKQLCEAHEQAVGKLVDIGDHAADDVAGGMAVEVGKRQLLQVGERLGAGIARDAEDDAVIDHIHHPLRRGAQQREHRDLQPNGRDRREDDLPRPDDGVDRLADEDRDIERGGDVPRRAEQREDDPAGIGL